MEIRDLVNCCERVRVASKIEVNTAAMSFDFEVPRKSVRKKYSLQALSINV